MLEDDTARAYNCMSQTMRRMAERTAGLEVLDNVPGRPEAKAWLKYSPLVMAAKYDFVVKQEEPPADPKLQRQTIITVERGLTVYGKYLRAVYRHASQHVNGLCQVTVNIFPAGVTAILHDPSGLGPKMTERQADLAGRFSQGSDFESVFALMLQELGAEPPYDSWFAKDKVEGIVPKDL